MKDLKKKFGNYFNKKRVIIILIISIFLLSFILRILFLPQKAITFGFDQARDGYVVQEIISGDLKIIGPSVSGMPGFFHGVLYYYFILPPYLLGGGNPLVVVYWLALFNSFAVFLIYSFVNKLFKNLNISLLASFIFAISFEQTQYATWLSNPSIAVVFVTILYLGLYLWGQKKFYVYGAVLAGLGLGMSVQSNLSLLYHLAPVGIWFVVKRKSISKAGFCYFIIAFLAAISSIILSQIKFGFPAFEEFAHIIKSTAQPNNMQAIFGKLSNYIQVMNQIFTNNIFPQNTVFGSVMGWGIIILGINKILTSRKNRDAYLICILWILSYFFGSFLGGHTRPHIGVGIGIGLIVLEAVFIISIWNKYKLIAILFLITIIFSNLVKILHENRNGQTIFAIQKDMILRNELSAIDFTYNITNGKDFSINSLTSPLYINTTWAYLYGWYGKSKYGYLPYWTGRDQIGSLGNTALPLSEIRENHFLIIEDMQGIPEIYLTYTLGEEDSKSITVEERRFSSLVVQKRAALIE